MKNTKIILSLSVLFLFKNAPVSAIEPLSCRNGFFPNDQKTLQIAEVNTPKGEKLYFYEDEEGCPAETGQCKKKSYVIAGDKLIINSVKEGWACAWFPGKKRETVGWVKANQLKLSSVASVDNSAWLGNWRFYDNSIKISHVNNKMQVAGEAFWYGAVVAGERVVHMGNLSGELRINTTHARLADEGDTEYGCAADFTQLGAYLVVSDNGNCGGANVSFSGIYTKGK